MIGKVLNHYTIVGRLGRGGMGEVWIARDDRLNRRVALKTLPSQVAADPDRRARFEREAQAVAALNHPNIVTIHSVEEAGEICFFTMELVEGKPLSELIPRQGMPLGRFFDTAIPLADALAAAHQKGITHRDLKPDNVMVTNEGRVKVLDFGLAKLAEPAGDAPGGATQMATATVTAEGKILGTVAYMSPEQAEGKPIDARSDVFSLGILLYEMATGQRPFEGDTPLSTITSILRDTPSPVGELKPALPRHMGRVIQRCLAKHVDRRYQAALDVRNELEGLRGEIDSGEIGRPVTAPPPRRPATRRRGVIAAIALGALALVAAGVFLLPRLGGGPSGGSRSAFEVDRSIAVLPFANMSEGEGNDFFSDGLAEELLNLLSKVPGLRVAARTSSFHFKGHTGSVAEIGHQLNVATILEGSVRRAQDRVRVTAQLVSAEDGFQLWSETYDRRLDDIFTIQEEIATQVVDALKITLLGESDEPSPLARRPTDNLEAYDAYLLGQQRMARRTSEALTEATGFFRRAIELDPDYAMAHVGLADAYMRLNDYGSLPVGEALAQAEPLVRRALELDDRLGEAHASLGVVQGFYRGDVEASDASFQRAIELSPNYPMAYMWYGLVLWSQDLERTRALLEKTLELDPLSAVANDNMAGVLAEIGRYEEALERYRHCIEIEPTFASAYVGMANLYAARLDRPEEAIEAFRKAIETDPGNIEVRVLLGGYLARLGRTDEARASIRQAIELGPEHAAGYLGMASLEADLGRLDEAVRLELQVLERDPATTDAYFSLFFHYLDLADPASARAWMRRFEEREPDYVYTKFMTSNWHVYHSEMDESEVALRVFARHAARFAQDQLWFYDYRAGRYAEARDRFRNENPELYVEEEEIRINPANLHRALAVAGAMLQTGERQRATALLRACESYLDSYDERRRRASDRLAPVILHAWQGRTDEALAAFRQAVDNGWRDGWWYARLDPALESLRDDPRFAEIFAEVRADVDRMRRNLAADGLANP